LLGRRPTEDEIDAGLVCLVGRPCRLIVGINPDTGYNSIESVLPAQLSDQAVAAYAEQADRVVVPPTVRPLAADLAGELPF
jgi:hypothetical protein